MGRLEVRGIVSSRTGEPLVQFAQLDDDGVPVARWQMDAQAAREQAQQIIEASFDAVYDAAIMDWARQMEDGENMGPQLLNMIREHRRDAWGVGGPPSDWRGAHFGVGKEQPT